MSKKYVGVVGVSKAENAQLGLLLKEVFISLRDNEKEGEDFIQLPVAIVRYPDAFNKLCARYS